MLRYLERTLIKRGVNAIFARILNVVHILIILFSIFLILDETIDRFSDYRSLRDKIAPGNQEILTILKNMEEGGESEDNMILVTEAFWNDVYVSWEHQYRILGGGISTKRYIPNQYTYKPFQVALVENGKLVIRQSLSFKKWLFIVEEDFYIILFLSPILIFPLICIILTLTLTFLYTYIVKGGTKKKYACPNCKNKLETKPSFCPYCAFDLSTYQPDMNIAFQTETIKPNSPMNCPICNAEVNERMNFCGSCGKELKGLENSREIKDYGHPGNKLENKKRPTAITIICVLGFLGAIFIIPLFFSDISKSVGSWYQQYLGFSFVVGLACMIGLWKMKKWAIFTYTGFSALNQIIMLSLGAWNIMSLSPLIVIVIGFIHLKKMT